MPKKDAEEAMVTRQVKQRRRNQEWYEFLMERRNALAHRLRSSAVATSHRSYGSLDVDYQGAQADFGDFGDFGDLGDLGEMGEGPDLPELDIDGDLLDAGAGREVGPQMEIASPAEALRLRTSSPAVPPPTPPTPQNRYGAHDTPSPYGYAALPPQVASHSDAEVGGSSPAIPGYRSGADASRLSSPLPYGIVGPGDTSAPARPPLWEQVEPPGALHSVDRGADKGAERGSPLRYIKGPGGATFALPYAPHSPYSLRLSSPMAQPSEGAIQSEGEGAASNFTARASSPSPSYLFGEDDWATGYDYSGAGLLPRDST